MKNLRTIVLALAATFTYTSCDDTHRNHQGEAYAPRDDGGFSSGMNPDSGSATNNSYNPHSQEPTVPTLNCKEGEVRRLIRACGYHHKGTLEQRCVDSVFTDVSCADPLANLKIAFESDRDGNEEIYIMNVDGSNQTRLTFNPFGDYEPSFSPDSSKIVWRSERRRDDQTIVDCLYLMNSDGSEQGELTCNSLGSGYGPFNPLWSPDSAQILFLRQDIPSTPTLYVINAENGSEIKLSENTHSAAWSPHGDKIIFDSNIRGDNFHPESLYTIHPNGSGLLRLVFTLCNTFESSWSPDGGQIVFSSYSPSGSACYTNNPALYIISSEGSGLTRITSHIPTTLGLNVGDFAPLWSPTGEGILFVSYREDGLAGIYRVDINGMNERRLTPQGVVDYGPLWSPDGERILFGSTQEGNEEIYVMDADGSNRKRLTFDAGRDRNPVWSPVNF